MDAVRGDTAPRPLRVLLVSGDPADSGEVMRTLRPEFPHLQLEQVRDMAQPIEALGAGRFELALVESRPPWADIRAIQGAMRARHLEQPIVAIIDADQLELPDCGDLGEVAGCVVRASHRMVGLATTVRLALEHARERRARRGAEDRYRALYDAVPVGLYSTTADGRLLDANLTLVELLGYPGRESLLAVNARDLYADAAEFDRLCSTLEQGKEMRAVETQLNRCDGSTTWVEHAVRARRARHQALCYEGTARDVSRRKQVERALRESEERFRTIVEQSPISIQVMTPDGWTVLVNRAWEELWGVTAEDVRNYNMLHDEQAATLGMMPYVQRGFAGETVSMPPVGYHTPETLKLGRRRWFQAHIYPVKGDHGAIRNVIMLYEDITERQWATEDLQRLSAQLMTAQEDERRRISRELHDELGQALTAMRINLSSLEGSLRPRSSTVEHERLVETGQLVDEMLVRVHELSLTFRPTMLDELGLVPTLRWYADRYARRLGIEVEFEAVGLDKRLPTDIETAVYRVAQEALTNIARHAQARRVHVRLLRRGSRLTATVHDDGAGFDLAAATTAGPTTSGAGLIGVRERIALLGGTLSLQAAPGRGTRLSVVVPIPPPSETADS